MSQVASRAPSQMKVGVSLPEIKHPMSQLGAPGPMDVRGVSRMSDSRPLSNPPLTGRPMANEGPTNVRKSFSAASGRSTHRNNKENRPIAIESIPEGVEVKYGDPAATRLPVFGSRAGMDDRDIASRASSRASRASGQARLEIDELEAVLKEKLKTSYYDIRKKFKDNDPEGRGNVSREAFTRILVTVLGRSINAATCQRLMGRLGFAERQVIPFTEFFAYFRLAAESTYPQWMDPVHRANQDRVVMNVSQVHANLRERAKQSAGPQTTNSTPQLNSSLSVYPSPPPPLRVPPPPPPPPFPTRYDPANEGVINGKRLLNALGIEWRGDPTDEPRSSRRSPFQDMPGRAAPQGRGSRRTPRKKEVERRQQLDVENWLKNKFREGFFNMREAFEDKDPERSGVVNFDAFLEVLGQFGLKMEKPLLGAFLSRCSVKAHGKGVPYREFLHRFQDRGETGMAHNVLTDVKHRYNNRTVSPEANSTISAVESQLTNMFQRDFLALLGMFKKIDHLGTDVISQEEFRAAIESRFNMDLTNSQFESFLDRVPLDQEGNVMYTRFMQQFDARLVREGWVIYISLGDTTVSAIFPFSLTLTFPLARSFDIRPEISRGEIRDLWRTFITNTDRTLDYLQFIRHFGFSMRSAAFPNAKLQPPRRGDADFMVRSRKLNCAADMLQDNLRAKVDYLWDDLRREFVNMDPYNTGFVTKEEFREVLSELCVNLSNLELEQLIAKFEVREDGRVSYIEFLKPFALRKQVWRHGNNMLSLLQHPQPELPIADIVEPPQKGLHGITAKLRQKLAGDWKNLRRAFRKLDVTGNGYLSLPEFRSVLKLANVILDEDEVYHVMTEFDRDLSGKISYEKFIEETFKPETRQSARGK
ncbi:hypothetical protein EGW08_003827 [Elysia chlorotica]|uniref:EF-hand domain-containing protein n=1 Tax=Elysia chlorotica TaxID=188477 RepID=A0A3S1A1U9_ELYCH|nr:hypothetical protein EGW08_003827 [Elysia chlorotica]